LITVDFRKFKLKKGSRVLDIGCGSGRHSAEVLKFRNIFVCGADLNAEDLKQAESRLNFHDKNGFNKGGSWGLVSSNITGMPFKAGSFDVIICSEVLEHIPRDTDAVSEMMRILKPGGYLIVSVPRFWPEAVCWFLSHEYRNSEGGHVRIYTKKSLTKLFSGLDLTFLTCHHAHSIHTPFWLLKCFKGLSKKSRLVDLYHRILVWDMMKKPAVTLFTDKLFNPVAGKSLVVYYQKGN